MNATQIQTTIAPLLTFLAGLAAGKGLFGWDAQTWYTILGGIAGLGATVWAAVTTRNHAVISQAAVLPEVQSIKMEASTSKATVDSLPGNVSK